MDKTLIGLFGGASALALLGGVPAPAAASPQESATLQQARSFAELLDPIPNAGNVLRAEDERGAAETSADDQPMMMAQYYYYPHHRHHHHHHYHHHHHHHRDYYPYHHHHHHHHHYYYNY